MKFIGQFVSAVFAVVAIAVIGGQPANAVTRWEQFYADEFESNQLDTTNWNVFSRVGYGNTDLLYSPSNISVANGNLVITTQRHCVSGPSVSPDTTNIHNDACPTGQITKYSSGRIQSNDFIDGSKPFKVEIKAKIDWNNTVGTRPALWMVNGVSYCGAADNEPLGELDILEWYARNPNNSYSTSHMTCNKDAAGKVTTRSFSHREIKSQPLTNEWHIWTVEYDGKSVRYLLDGTPVDVTSKNINGVVQQTPNYGSIENNADLGVTPQETQDIMSRNWRIIINDLVEATAGPDATASFPAQHFLIDYVRVSKEAVQTPQTTPDATTQPQKNPNSLTDQGIEKTKSDDTTGQLASTGASIVPYLTVGVAIVTVGVLVFFSTKIRTSYNL